MAALVAAVALCSAGTGAASAAWLPAVDAAPSSATVAGSPAVGVARDGTAFVAFPHSDGANTRIGVVQRSHGGGFGQVRDLSTPGENAFSPAIAIDRQGNATLAWGAIAGGSTVLVEARFRPAGGDWQAIQTLAASGAASGPTVAAGDNGAAVVSWWESLAGPVVRVEAAIKPAGSANFGGGIFASPNVTGSQQCQEPHVAMDAAGDVAAIWTRRTPDPTAQYLVESAVKAAGAAAFDTSQPRSGTTGSSPSCLTSIAMTPEGRVLAAWDFDDTTDAVPAFVQYADRSAPFSAGTWSTAVQLSSPGVDSHQPQVVLDDGGNASAIWLTTGAVQLVSAVRNGLGGFTAPKPLSNATASFDQALAASPSGDAMALFVGMSNGTDAIFSARRRTTTDFDEVTTVATTPPDHSTTLSGPTIGLDDQGNGFGAWMRDVSTGGGDQFTAQIAGYDPVPPSIGNVSVPGTGTAGQAVAMSAGATDRMSAASIHFDFGDGSGADGASVQHVYGAAGGYTVTVKATDAAGNQSTTTRTIQIAPAPAGAGGPGGGGGGPGGSGGTGPGSNKVLAVTALSYDRLANGRTRLRSLIVDRLDKADVVKLSCKGKGCRKKANRTIRKHGRRLSLTKFVKGMTLSPKAVITITVSRPGITARVFRYTMVRAKDPKKSTRCRPPGQKKLTVC